MADKVKSIELQHPIIHDGKEYERGVYEMDSDLADALLSIPDSPARKIEIKKPEFKKPKDAADSMTGLAAQLYADGKSVDEVAEELGITKKQATALKPKGQE